MLANQIVCAVLLDCDMQLSVDTESQLEVEVKKLAKEKEQADREFEAIASEVKTLVICQLTYARQPCFLLSTNIQAGHIGVQPQIMARHIE
jgi:hypothetical protein